MKIKLIGKTLVCEHLKEDEMHLEKGDKSMVTHKANIVDTDGERWPVKCKSQVKGLPKKSASTVE